MPTSKSLRAAPARTFENYILTLTKDSSAGLTNVPQEKFIQVPDAGGSGLTNTVSNEINIGFPFTYDGITYERFVACTSGWVALADPNYNFSYSHIMQSANINGSIKPTFTRSHSLFAVWFDDLRNTYNSTAGLSFNSLQTENYEKGLAQPDNRLNTRKFGIQYYNDNTSPDGRRLIVRWRSLSDYNTPAGSILEFEFVLYENGKIEYRYPPRTKLFIAKTINEDATIGVFMPNGTWRFRDFSYELGYATATRTKYKFGGYVSGSFTETDDITNVVPYAVNLTPEGYWPAEGSFGAIFTFQPPLNRRKVLPRVTLRERDSRLTLPTTARTGDSRTGAGQIIFDDRKSISYYTSSVVINYPTTLPRFYAPNIQGVTQNQDLFAGEFAVTGGISYNNVQDYLESNQKNYVAPFNENKLFENDPGASSDSFYTEGTKISEVGEGFNQSLKSKTQIRLSFRVDHKTTMFGASSSMYYFNSKTGRWQYPTASFVNGANDISNPYSYAVIDSEIHADRGFNAFGFNITSGSSGSGDLLGKLWLPQNEIQAMMGQFDKSTQIDSRYSANSDESFTIPIQQPFLLEKAVIELPFEAGPGWFNDKTRCFIPLTSVSPGSPDEATGGTFDIGGPGLTVALYNQISSGPNKNRRDLILSGTVTHEFDDVAEIAFSNTPNIAAGGSSNWPGGASLSGYVWQAVPRGFRAYGTPTAVVSGSLSGSNYYYTGSVALKCQAQISNGVLVRDAFYIAQGFGPGYDTSYALAALDAIFSSSQWSLPGDRPITAENFGQQAGGGGFRYRTINAINNFGRGGGGFEPSGRSIFGKEYVTTQGSTNYYENPFYLYQGTNTLTDIKSRISAADPNDADSIVYASSLISRGKSFASPYLLFPGDKLVLSVSKTRPVFFSTLTSQPYTSGSIQHDIKLTTGSINITLYGSLVANGREFHDTLNQPLASDAVHEVVIGGTKTW